MYDNFDQIIALYEVINIHNCVCNYSFDCVAWFTHFQQLFER